MARATVTRRDFLKTGAAAGTTLVIAAPHFIATPIFDTPALWWVGLSTAPPISVSRSFTWSAAAFSTTT